MKAAVIIVLFAAGAIAQPMPAGSPPCPTGLNTSKCKQFFDCMNTQVMPPPPPQPAPGQQPPTPSPALIAQIEKSEKTCFSKAGMNSTEQATLKAALSQPPPQGLPPCPTGVNNTRCTKFFGCMMTMSQSLPPPPMPPQPVQGQQPPTPSPDFIAQLEKLVTTCFTQAGFTSAEQDKMMTLLTLPPQGPPPMNGQQG